MNQLQQQIFMGYSMPILNPSQFLFKDDAFAAGTNMDLSTAGIDVTNVSVIVLVHNETAGTGFKGSFTIKVTTNSGSTYASCSNETSVFFNTCDDFITEITAYNDSNGQAIIIAYS